MNHFFDMVVSREKIVMDRFDRPDKAYFRCNFI